MLVKTDGSDKGFPVRTQTMRKEISPHLLSHFPPGEMKKYEDHMTIEFIRDAAKGADVSIMEWLEGLRGISLDKDDRNRERYRNTDPELRYVYGDSVRYEWVAYVCLPPKKSK